MESLLGLIIFGVIAAISGLSNLIEKRKEEELRRQRSTRRQVDDLPEATRKMLYGEGGPPVAKRRGDESSRAPQAVPAREVRPRRPVPQGQETAPPRRPVPQRRELPPSAPQPRDLQPRQPERQERPMYPSPQERQATSTASQTRSTLEENWRRAQQRVQQRAPEPRVDRAQSAEQPRRESTPPRPATEPVRQQRRRQASIVDLLHHPKTLRTSMMLHEVLGRPKSMR